MFQAAFDGFTGGEVELCSPVTGPSITSITLMILWHSKDVRQCTRGNSGFLCHTLEVADNQIVFGGEDCGEQLAELVPCLFFLFLELML